MTSLLAPHLILEDPLTAGTLSLWIKSCENEFEKFELFNSNITDRSKIAFAGSAIMSSKPAAEGLRQWWNMKSDELKTLGWRDFVENLKLEALGRHRRLDALQAVYRVQQSGRSADEYIKDFREAKGSLDLVDARAIDEQQYKHLLLFRADERLCARVCAVPGFDINTITLSRLEGLLYEFGYAVETNNQSPKKLGKWEQSEPWGFFPGTGPFFSDFDIESPPTSIKHASTISLFEKKYGGTVFLGGYSHDLLWQAADAPITVSRFATDENTPGAKHLTLYKEEYIVEMAVSRSKDVIECLSLTTNLGDSVTMGKRRAEMHTVKAPEGYMIAGFHGTAYNQAYPTWISNIGALFAPL